MIGALLSALWILIANSWQQTPAGYKIEDGKAILTDFWAAALNPSIAPRYVHTIVACVIAGCFVVASICGLVPAQEAPPALRPPGARHRRSSSASSSRRPCRSSATGSALVVAEYQPVKMAAFENALRDAGRTRPCTSFGWVRDNDGDPEVTGLTIPSGLSLMLGLSPDHVVTGLDSVPPAGPARRCRSPSRATTS